MFRRLCNLAATASLLLLFAAVACWGRGHWKVDWIDGDRLNPHGDCEAEWWFRSSNGEIEAGYARLVRPRWFRLAQFAHWRTADANQVDPSPKLRFGYNSAADIEYAILNDTRNQDRPLDGAVPGDWGVGYPRWTRTLVFPWYAVAAAAALLPAVRAVRLALDRWRRRRERRTGRCAGCGYDLRASPARCPECGRSAPEHPGAAGSMASHAH